jgi:ADP-heptose:LPS heptosyltransferase
MRKVILDKGQSPGDILVFTGALRDLKLAYPDWQIDVRTNDGCKALFEGSPHITPLNEADEGVECHDVGYRDIHHSGWSGRHFSAAYHLELEALLGVPVPQTSMQPDLHLSDAERASPTQVELGFGYRGPYWLICAGHKADYPLKEWGADRWQRLVDLLANRVQFVQVGEKAGGHEHAELRGVLSLVGQTDTRQLMRLAYHAQGAACHVTFLMHLMATWRKPCVVVAGGREPRRWEMYPNHRYLDTCGWLPCCDYNGCWQSGHMEHGDDDGKQHNKQCKHLSGGRPRCMSMISPERVAEELLGYIDGGVARG